jgi:hypothetical protein
MGNAQIGGGARPAQLDFSLAAAYLGITMEDAPATQAISPAPASWPGAFGAFKPSREVVRRNLSTLVILVLVSFGASFVLSMLQSGFSPSHHSSSPNPLLINIAGIGALFQALSSLLAAFINGAQVKTYLAGLRGQSIEFNQAAVVGWQNIWKMFALNLLVGLSVLGGLILLIIPGLIIAVRLSLAPYFLIDQNLDPVAAYKASWHATKGNSGKIWGIIGVNFLMILPVITIIGILATAYLLFMYSAAMAVLYASILRRPQPSA